MTDRNRDVGLSKERQIFETVFLPGYRGWWSLITSVSLHCALIPSLPWLGMLLPDSGDSARPRYAVTIRPLQIQLPDLVYATAAASRPKETARPRPAAEASKTPPRRFELPPLPRKTTAEQIILQPEFSPNLPPQDQVRLPNVVFWNTARLPKPQPRSFVHPGSPKPMAPKVPVLEAPPTLALPNRETLVSDIVLSGGVVSANPSLPRPPSTTIPVRVFQPPSSRSSGGLALDAIEGDPTTLIALSPSPAPIGRSIIVPAGNQLGDLPGPPDETGGVGTGKESGTGRGTGAGIGMGSEPEGGGILGGAKAPSGLAGVPARVVHPNAAAFDVVVQSASAGALPDTTDILSGKPVYTVYVRVGSERDWVLQYCRPESAERNFRTSGSVVTLGNPSPVKAPYPLVTVMPPAAVEPRREPILVHGFLDTSGKLKALKIVREQADQWRKLLLPSLEQWEFRPGTRDGLPVLLEILLVIPANRA